MSRVNISPIKKASKLRDGLENIINEYILIIEKFKKEAEYKNDWTEYNKCFGKISAYKEILRILKELNIQ